MAWLARRLGLSCDNVAAYELVTAEGDRLRVDETTDPELFWGLRGGGNFGVVTGFEFPLHPVASVGFVWAGEPEPEPQLLPALRALGRPVAERVQGLSYLELQRMDDTLEGHAPPLLEGPLLPRAAGRGDRRLPPCAARPTGTASGCPRHRCRPTAARSPTCRTSTQNIPPA